MNVLNVEMSTGCTSAQPVNSRAPGWSCWCVHCLKIISPGRLPDQSPQNSDEQVGSPIAVQAALCGQCPYGLKYQWSRTMYHFRCAQFL